MNGIDWLFPALLFTALVVSAGLTFRQQRRYSLELNEAAKHSTGARDALLSGRGRGLLRGAIVILVVDRENERVQYAAAMVGASVFAKFRERPELLGSLDGTEDRATQKCVKKAVAVALEQLPPMSRPKTSDNQEALDRARAARSKAHAKNHPTTPRRSALVVPAPL